MAFDSVTGPVLFDAIVTRRAIDGPPIRPHEDTGTLPIPLNGKPTLVHEPMVGRAETDQVVEARSAAVAAQPPDHRRGRSDLPPSPLNAEASTCTTTSTGVAPEPPGAWLAPLRRIDSAMATNASAPIAKIDRVGSSGSDFATVSSAARTNTS
jgi:hypothetical protein